MADKKLMMRVGALGLMGGAAVFFAAQAGVLPGLDRGTATAGMPAAPPIALSAVPAPPSAQTPAALAAALQGQNANPPMPADAFVASQTLGLPETSGFAVAPVIAVAAPAVAADADLVRPAAFNMAAVLPLPGAALAETPDDTAKDLSPFGLPCGLDVTAEASGSAMIALGVAAPCNPDAVVTIIHSGMTVAENTDAFGLMTLDLPALETPAFVTVSLPDGSENDIIVDVPDLGEYDRVALAWQGDLGVELHVMEDGAAWMSDGHVHAGAPRNPGATLDGDGYLTLLGNPAIGTPQLAQVYTMPRQNGPATVALSVDAPVTLGNCAQTAEARVLQVTGGANADMIPLGFTYPTCDAVGDTLVLQNVFGDLRLASN